MIYTVKALIYMISINFVPFIIPFKKSVQIARYTRVYLITALKNEYKVVALTLILDIYFQNYRKSYSQYLSKSNLSFEI